MDISIVIINYKTRDFTINCITSILKHVDGVEYEIILVENASGEFSTAEIKKLGWDNKVKLVISRINRGFAGGNNLGLKYAVGKYSILLNSDTVLKDNAILKVFQFMESHPEIGVLSPRLVYPDGTHQSVAQRFPSLFSNLVELFRIQKLLPRKKAGRLLLGAFFNHDETVCVDWVWGAFFMFPRRLLEKLNEGKLDETYFMYCEDIQWCMDIKKLGYKICFYAEVEVIHVMGSNAPTKNRQKTKMMRSNYELLLNRNYPKWESRLIRFTDKLLGK